MRPERILLAGDITCITVPMLQRSLLATGGMFDEERRPDVPCTVRFRSTEELALKSPQVCRVHLCGVNTVERYYFDSADRTWFLIECAINDRKLVFNGVADRVRKAYRSYAPLFLRTVVGYSFSERRGHLFTFAYWSRPTDGQAETTFLKNLVSGNFEAMQELVLRTD